MSDQHRAIIPLWGTIRSSPTTPSTWRSSCVWFWRQLTMSRSTTGGDCGLDVKNCRSAAQWDSLIAPWDSLMGLSHGCLAPYTKPLPTSLLKTVSVNTLACFQSWGTLKETQHFPKPSSKVFVCVFTYQPKPYLHHCHTVTMLIMLILGLIGIERRTMTPPD